MPSKKTLRVVLLAYDDMNLLDLCGPLQALATASKRHTGKGPALYETIVASADGGMVTTSAGLPVMTVSIASLDGLVIDTLIAPGGCKGQEYYAPPTLVNWIVRQAPLVRRLCSVCTGAFLLAAAGQLDGKRATTHWEWVNRLQSQYPGINIDADKIFIQDGSVWSSAGVSAGIDLTLALIEEDYGHHVAIETARQLVMFIKRTGGQSQFSVPLAAQAHEGGRFDGLHAWVAANLHENLSVERLAEKAGMTPRTFARTYASQSGRTPARMVEAMRLEAACRALEKTMLPLKAIAANTGYVEEQNLRRVFQRQLGVSPSQYRSRFSGHGATVN
ncbi:GlxA family transcriptional regulator [Duganella violaceipulchra]|uniref:GlxA family transcriptional regulator n=1 Tax=Duganella violaceipulchra TaxID=2849652 RepID=A0AA41L400_9BURK|nr:GlxA family transcriptional regulator [Duganella violaceicalia]MBV6322329.1 GlxA family transcriptional regulator [Duganella violaceicalia]MCP2011476.1 transcriptional regulator GlxA family with amidase domain [Duganella violaceicalia]